MSADPYQAPVSAPTSVTPRRTFTMKRIDPISCGSMLGVLYGIMGLLVGGVFSLLAIIGAAAAGDGMAGMAGMFAVIMFPAIYGAMGFIGGCIGALMYNACSGIVGGIKFDLE